MNTVENSGKLWEMLGNGGNCEKWCKWWKIEENCGKCWKMVGNCEKWWEMVKHGGK